MERIDSIKVKITKKEILGSGFDFVNEFNDGLALVRKNGKYGYIDKLGNIIVPLIYESANDFSEGLAAVRKAKKWGYIDKTGKVVIPFYFDNASDFSEGLAIVCEKKKYGYVDREGNIIIPFQYKAAEDFEQGLALVKKEGKSNFIDKKGNVVASFEKGAVKQLKDKCISDLREEISLRRDNFKKFSSNFEYISDFKESIATVKGDIYDENQNIIYSGMYCVDEKGNPIINEIVETKYITDISSLDTNVTDVKIEGYYTCFNLSNKTIVIEEIDYDTYIRKVNLVNELISKELQDNYFHNLAEINSQYKLKNK